MASEVQEEMSVTATHDSVLLTLDFSPLHMTDEEFYEFCQRNQDFRFEMDKEGNLIVTPPTFLETSRKNTRINVRLGAWAEQDNTGVAFESDGMFTLPNGAKRVPDAFWILKGRYDALSKEEREERFARIGSRLRYRVALKVGQSTQTTEQNARIHRKRRAARVAD